MTTTARYPIGSLPPSLARYGGGIPVAVVSSAGRGEYCVSLGAAGFIDRTQFSHWGTPPHWTDEAGQRDAGA